MICEDNTALSICYTNPKTKALHLPQGTSLQDCLALDEGTFAEVRRRLAGTGGSVTLRRRSYGAVALEGTPFVLEGKDYIKLCLRKEDMPLPQRKRVQDFLELLRRLQERGNVQEGIACVLSHLGLLLDAERLTFLEKEADACISASSEWCAEGVASLQKDRQNIPKNELYSRIMEMDLDEGEENLVLSSGDETVAALSSKKRLLSVAIVQQHVSLGYLLAEGRGGAGVFAREDAWFMEESARILASLLQYRERERQLQYQVDILNTVSRHLDGMLCVHDCETGEILFANRALSDAFALPLRALREHNITWLWKQMGQEDSVPMLHGRRELHQPSTGKWYAVYRQKIRWIDERAVYVERLLDISTQKEWELLASTDAMTGTYNREWACRFLKRLTDRQDDTAWSLVFVDIDNLKCINDRYGHAEGDAMIRNTVQMIQQNIRKQDAICRWGGDEFLVMMQAEEADCHRVMEQILQGLALVCQKTQETIPISFSFGVSSIPRDSTQTLQALVEEADQKMYENKILRRTKAGALR